MNIEADQRRFDQIVRGKIRQDFKKYIRNADLLQQKNGQILTIPLPQIDLPKFTFDAQQQGGVGQGPGELGQSLQDQEPSRPGKAGAGKGEHELEVDITLDELAVILGEELQLPPLQPRGSDHIRVLKNRSSGIQTTGPESMRHFKRTYRQALKRQIMLNGGDTEYPLIIPTREDRRYRSFRPKPEPDSQAVIVYMMDVSGSMGDEQKEIVRLASFWIDVWLRHQYPGIETKYIVHDSVAQMVDKYTFFHTRESGGTMISSAYKLCAELIAKQFPPSLYNIYLFHFSDGDNWSTEDTEISLQILQSSLLNAANMFGYAQVESPYGSGQFIRDLSEHFGSEAKLQLSELQNKDTIHQCLIDFFGKKSA